MTVTALRDCQTINSKIGYEKAAIIAKNANVNGTSLRETALKTGFISSKDFDNIVCPRKMI